MVRVDQEQVQQCLVRPRTAKRQKCPWRRRRGRLFLASNTKMHEPEQKSNVRKCKTVRLDESYRLVTTAMDIYDL